MDRIPVLKLLVLLLRELSVEDQQKENLQEWIYQHFINMTIVTNLNQNKYIATKVKKCNVYIKPFSTLPI